MQEKTVWTIGHSTHTFDEFVVMLKSFRIGLVGDIRMEHTYTKPARISDGKLFYSPDNWQMQTGI